MRNIGLIRLICPIGLITIGLISPITAAKTVAGEAGETALSVTPSIQEMVVKPGEQSEQIFELKNLSKIPLPIKSYIRTFGASDEAGGVDISEAPDEQRLALTSWAGVLEPDFILQPNSVRQIKIYITPPPDLPPGGYYGILFFEPLLPEYFLSENSLNIGGRIGALLFLVGAGEIRESGKILSLSAKKYQFGGRPSDIIIRFQNEGNVHLRPSGKITVTNLITKKTKEAEASEFTVLPGKIRQQIIALEGAYWPGVYKAKVQLSFGRDKITLNKTFVFYYLPIMTIVAIIVLIGMLIVLFWGKTRKRAIKALKMILKGE